MKILLIAPPSEIPIAGSSIGNFKRKGSKRFSIMPPLGLLYIGRELLDNGFDVEVIDYSARNFNYNELQRSLTDADVVGVKIISFFRKEGEELVSLIRKIKPNIKIIIGGPDITINPRLPADADVAVIGEAEFRIVDIVKNLINRGDLSNIPGIIFYDKNKKIKWTDSYPLIKNLDDIKFPARNLIKDKYSVLGKYSDKTATIITSRGCPFSCKFCERAPEYKKYRERSAENVLKEIEELYSKGYEIFGIVDDCFTANLRRAKKIFEGIIYRGLKIIIGFEGRTDVIEEEFYELMSKAGVRLIYFGMESGNQDVLDFYNKKTKVENNEIVAKLCQKYNIYSIGSFIIGAPIETLSHIERTINFMCKIPIDFGTIWTLDLPKGSPLWEKAYFEGKVKEDEYDVPACKERGLSQFTYKELSKFAINGFIKFYSRPKFWLNVLGKLFKEKDKRIISIAFSVLYSYLSPYFD